MSAVRAAKRAVETGPPGPAPAPFAPPTMNPLHQVDARLVRDELMIWCVQHDDVRQFAFLQAAHLVASPDGVGRVDGGRGDGFRRCHP